MSNPKDSSIKYTYDAIVESKQFIRNNWALRAILDKDRMYTLQEARDILNEFLNRKVN